MRCLNEGLHERGSPVRALRAYKALAIPITAIDQPSDVDSGEPDQMIAPGAT